jgi:hypothetical protein
MSMYSARDIGMWVWQLKKCGKNPALLLQSLGVRRVYLKVSDGTKSFKQNTGLAGKDFVERCSLAGIEVWAWAYNYDKSIQRQAEVLLREAKSINADGIILNTERAFVDGDEWDETALDGLLDAAVSTQRHVGLSSYRQPQFFPDFPWHVLSRYPSVFAMPQVYFLKQAETSAKRVAKSIKAWSAIGNPVIATLGAWEPKNTPVGIQAGADTVHMLAEKGLCMPSFDLWSLMWLYKAPKLAKAVAAISREAKCFKPPKKLAVHPLDDPWFQKAALLRLKAYYGPLGRGWTPKARAALKEFQRDSNHYKAKVDGIWGPKTRRAVRKALKEQGIA